MNDDELQALRKFWTGVVELATELEGEDFPWQRIWGVATDAGLVQQERHEFADGHGSVDVEDRYALTDLGRALMLPRVQQPVPEIKPTGELVNRVIRGTK